MDNYPAPGRNHVFVPGPVNIPDAVLRAMNRNNEDHRSPAFPILSKSCIDDVKQLFKTKTGTTFIFPTTGVPLASSELFSRSFKQPCSWLPMRMWMRALIRNNWHLSR